MAESREITVPEMGGADAVTVAEILVAVGDQVTRDQSLVALESDKASMEIPSNHAGTVQDLSVKVGDEVREGDPLLALTVESDADPTAAPQAASAPGQSTTEADPPPRADQTAAAPASEALARPIDATNPATLPYASPSVRKRARELGLDLATVPGSGRNGRITLDDLATVPGRSTDPGIQIPAMPAIDFAQFGAVETVPLTRINKLTGANLHRSWVSVPHVTQFDDADITELEAFRKAKKAEAGRRDTKLTFVPFLLAACAAALREFPRFNASLSPDAESLVLKGYINIGVAVDTPKGLVVPVVRGVDEKRIYELADELTDISTRARAGKLLPADFQGGTFTISSLGGIGGTAFTPIVNAPEVAILGVSRTRMTPEWNGEAFEPRLMLPLSLSYDHRVIDGAAAARFTRYLAETLADLRNLLL